MNEKDIETTGNSESTSIGLLSDKEQLEWLWNNCRITYYSGFPEYPIEHAPHAKKDGRMYIEQKMKSKESRNTETAHNEGVDLQRVVIKPCPCGKASPNLCIEKSSTAKWALVYGGCCGEWIVEFRTKYHHIDSPECIELATAKWNRAPRAL